MLFKQRYQCLTGSLAAGLRLQPFGIAHIVIGGFILTLPVFDDGFAHRHAAQR